MTKNTNRPPRPRIPSSQQNNSPISSKPENEVNEPETIYQKKNQVRHFNSFEEMNEADAQEMAAIDPVDHLRNTTLLTKKVFSEELKKPMDMTIKFK